MQELTNGRDCVSREVATIGVNLHFWLTIINRVNPVKHLFLSLSAGTVMCARAFAVDLGGTSYETAGAEFDIDPVLLYSVALVESAAATEDGSETISPYPWTLRSDKPFYGNTRKEAVAELARTPKRGPRVDVGLTQLNVR